MSVTDLAVAAGAGVVGFAIIWGLFSLVRQQRAPPVEMFKTDSVSSIERDGKLSLAQLGRTWHTVLGVPAEATLTDIESAYRARLAECDGVRFSPNAAERDKQDADTRRAQVTDAYEFIRGAKR